jgi:hypothetical protein
MAKLVEVDEDEWNRMTTLRAVAAKIVSNSSARKMLEQAHKMVEPNAPTPMLDAEAAHLAPIKETEKRLSEEIAALKKEREDEKREQTLASIAQRQQDGLNRLRRNGYTDEGVAAVQKLMEDKGLLDVDDAVAIFERNHPPQVPATPGGGITGQPWNFTDVGAGEADKSIQQLIDTRGGNDSLVDRMAANALNEFRQSMGTSRR